MLSPPPKSADTPWEPWDMVNFGDPKQPAPNAKSSPKTAPAATTGANEGNQNSAAQIEAARKEGYQAGFDSGRSDGLTAGRETAEAEARKLAAQLGQAIARFDSGVADLERVVADELLALAIEIARKVVSQSIVIQPQAILGTIHEALALLPAQHAAIHLNATDAALVRLHAGEQLARAGHRIHEDAKLGRGDVVIEAGGAHLDCRLAMRWQRVIATLDQDVPWLIEDEAEPS